MGPKKNRRPSQKDRQQKSKQEHPDANDIAIKISEDFSGIEWGPAKTRAMAAVGGQPASTEVLQAVQGQFAAMSSVASSHQSTSENFGSAEWGSSQLVTAAGGYANSAELLQAVQSKVASMSSVSSSRQTTVVKTSQIIKTSKVQTSKMEARTSSMMNTQITNASVGDVESATMISGDVSTFSEDSSSFTATTIGNAAALTDAGESKSPGIEIRTVEPLELASLSDALDSPGASLSPRIESPRLSFDLEAPSSPGVKTGTLSSTSSVESLESPQSPGVTVYSTGSSSSSHLVIKKQTNRKMSTGKSRVKDILESKKFGSYSYNTVVHELEVVSNSTCSVEESKLDQRAGDDGEPSAALFQESAKEVLPLAAGIIEEEESAEISGSASPVITPTDKVIDKQRDEDKISNYSRDDPVGKEPGDGCLPEHHDQHFGKMDSSFLVAVKAGLSTRKADDDDSSSTSSKSCSMIATKGSCLESQHGYNLGSIENLSSLSESSFSDSDRSSTASPILHPADLNANNLDERFNEFLRQVSKMQIADLTFFRKYFEHGELGGLDLENSCGILPSDQRRMKPALKDGSLMKKLIKMEPESDNVQVYSRFFSLDPIKEKKVIFMKHYLQISSLGKEDLESFSIIIISDDGLIRMHPLHISKNYVWLLVDIEIKTSSWIALTSSLTSLPVNVSIIPCQPLSSGSTVSILYACGDQKDISQAVWKKLAVRKCGFGEKTILKFGEKHKLQVCNGNEVIDMDPLVLRHGGASVVSCGLKGKVKNFLKISILDSSEVPQFSRFLSLYNYIAIQDELPSYVPPKAFDVFGAKIERSITEYGHPGSVDCLQPLYSYAKVGRLDAAQLEKLMAGLGVDTEDTTASSTEDNAELVKLYVSCWSKKMSADATVAKMIGILECVGPGLADVAKEICQNINNASMGLPHLYI